MIFENIVIAENIEADNFYPLSILHCVWEIRAGANMLFERIKLLFPNANIFYSTIRNLHLKSFKARFDIHQESVKLLENVLVLPASILSDINFNSFLDNIDNSKDKNLFTNDILNEIFRKSIEFDENKSFEDYLNPNEIVEVIKLENLSNLKYLWDALDGVPKSIDNDYYF